VQREYNYLATVASMREWPVTELGRLGWAGPSPKKYKKG
jgi:hypothetical protein